MKKTVLVLALATLALGAAAQTHPAQRYVDRLAAEEPLHSAAWGVVARNSSGETLVSLNPDQKLAPASNMKLVTTGCALHALGSDFRFETKLGYSGEIRDGVLLGDLYIIGGGDPTLATADSIVLKTPALFWQWKTLLREAGIGAIQGRVIGDGRRWFQGNLENSSWEYDDLGTYYGAGGNGLSFYANAQDFAVSAGEKAGDPVRVSVEYPETPWMHFVFRGTTEAEGTGNSLYMYTTDLAPYAEMRGTFALDRKPKTENFANKFGALTCAYYFWKSLKDAGWEVTGGYADIDRGGYIRGADFIPEEKAATPKAIGSTWSPTLDMIARETNGRSDNFYAETLLRALGEKGTGSIVYDSCQVAEKKILEELKVDLSKGIVIEDGSGLSRHNFVSPDFLVRYLTAMQDSPAFDRFLWSLPRPGGNGTLKYLFRREPAIAGRIRMKSGSMNGVLCYSGYILPEGYEPGKPIKGEVITFSILTNNCDAPVPVVRDKILRIISLLAK